VPGSFVRVAVCECLGRLGGESLRLLEAVGRHEHAGERRAGLSRVEVALADAVGDRLGEVGVVEQDVGRLPAELEGDPLHGAGRHLGHPLAGPGRSGERDHVDVGVGGERLADHRPVAAHEVEHPGGQADLVEDLGKRVRREGGDLGRLQHDRAPGGEGGTDLEHDLVEREVPRRDAADDADRLPEDHRVADLLALEREGAGELGEVREVERREADLDDLGEAERHAHVPGQQGGRLVGTGDDASCAFCR
jgi:hypothetical protein